MERMLLTAEEAAESLKVGRCKVYDLIRTGELESIKIGRLRRILPRPRRTRAAGSRRPVDDRSRGNPRDLLHGLEQRL